MAAAKKLGLAVLTISDTRSLAEDRSGDILKQRIIAAQHNFVARAVVQDSIASIQQQIAVWTEDAAIDVIITTGGTGLTGKDVTPEALTPLFDKTIDGFSALFHRVSMETIGLSTMLSRATAGIVKGTYIFALPGSTGAVRDAWDNILVHLLDSNHQPCNLVEIMPRLLEK